jgi:hypothetical protein
MQTAVFFLATSVASVGHRELATRFEHPHRINALKLAHLLLLLVHVTHQQGIGGWQMDKAIKNKWFWIYVAKMAVAALISVACLAKVPTPASAHKFSAPVATQY